MSNIFYLFGFFYIVDQFKIIYESIFKGKEGFEMVEELFDDLDKGIKVRKKNIRSVFDIISSVCIISWIICGIAFTEYHSLFVAMLILSVLFYFMSWITAYLYLKNNKDHIVASLATGNPKEAVKKMTEEMPKIHSIVVTEGLLKIAITSYIIYSHFNCLI